MMFALPPLSGLALLALAAAVDPEPPLLQSGMDLLYSERPAFAPTGEPLVTIGLMTGQDKVELESASPLVVDFYDAVDEGVHKRTTVAPGTRVSINLRRAQAATKRHFVELDSVPWADRKTLDATLALWRKRGFPNVEALEAGVVMGLGGRVLDNRVYRVVAPCASAAAATTLAASVYTKYKTRGLVGARLAERPWGELNIGSAQGPLGVATSYVRFAPVEGPSGAGVAQPKPTKVAAVEFGRGYDWHGFEDRAYHGELYVVIDPDGKLAVVNVVGAETLLKGVVPSELFASAPPEALKAQAVAARNHLLAKLGLRHHGDPFQLCAEQHCQVYTGVAREDPRANAAVDETWGQALLHPEAGLVHAVYSSTCGGYTEDNDTAWGDHPDAALRGKPDFDVAPAPTSTMKDFADGITEANIGAWVTTTPESYCARASFARPQKLRWQKRLDAKALAELLGDRFGDPALRGALRDLVVRERGRGGKVTGLELWFAKKKAPVVVLLELPIRQLFGNLNSAAFRLVKERDAAGALTAVTFEGAGWGHGVGMCQMGAIGRAEAGQDYQTILAHYFNGATVAVLYGRGAQSSVAAKSGP